MKQQLVIAGESWFCIRKRFYHGARDIYTLHVWNWKAYLHQKRVVFVFSKCFTTGKEILIDCACETAKFYHMEKAIYALRARETSKLTCKNRVCFIVSKCFIFEERHLYIAQVKLKHLIAKEELVLYSQTVLPPGPGTFIHCKYETEKLTCKSRQLVLYSQNILPPGDIYTLHVWNCKT